jgi:hypothetical protein
MARWSERLQTRVHGSGYWMICIEIKSHYARPKKSEKKLCSALAFAIGLSILSLACEIFHKRILTDLLWATSFRAGPTGFL